MKKYILDLRRRTATGTLDQELRVVEALSLAAAKRIAKDIVSSGEWTWCMGVEPQVP